MHEYLVETRLATRSLLRSRGFAATTIITLALAFAAVVSIFGVVRGVILKALPYPDAERLVAIDHAAPGIGAQRGLQLTPGMWAFYRERVQTIEHLAAWRTENVNLSDAGAPERIQAAFVTWTLGSALRTTPVLGRFFTEDDDTEPGTAAAVLTHGLWSRRFGSDPAVIERNVTIDGVDFRIVGVMPEDFTFPSPRTGILLPLRIDAARTGFGSFSLNALARLTPGASSGQVESELATLIAGLSTAYPSANVEQVVTTGGLAPLVTNLRVSMVRDVARLLWLLLGGVTFVLLIAVANVVNLFVVRGEARSREVAVRSALGAGRGRLLRLFLVESILIAVSALAVAMVLVSASLSFLRTVGPPGLPRLHELGLDPMLILLGIALSVVAALGLGLVPMFQRAPAFATLRQSGTGARGGRGVTRFRNALATGQVALGMVLLVAAGLMIRSHSELRRVDAGFSPSGVLTFEVGLPRIGYETREAAVQALNEMLAGIRSLPGVTTAGVANCLPLCGSWAGDAWRAQDAPPRPGEFPPIAATRRVSPGYLEALRVPVVAGRLLTQVDEDQRSGAAVISERLAGRLWPGEPAVGRLVYHGEPARATHWYRVVGVVANTPVRELTDDPVPMAYLPLLHSDSTRGPGPWLMSAVVRTSIPPERLVESVRSVVAGVDPAVPLARVRTLQAIVDDAGSRTAFTMTLLVIAASVSLVLGCVGTYGVTSYMVTRRGAEFGIRMALGAQRGDISRIVARHTALVVGAGLIIGVGGALALTKLMRALLHGISPGDPATYLTMSALLAIAGVAAAWFPVRRAVRIPPAAVLRGD